MNEKIISIRGSGIKILIVALESAYIRNRIVGSYHTLSANTRECPCGTITMIPKEIQVRTDRF